MRRALLAALLAFSLSSVTASAAQARGAAPGSYMPDETTIPAGYEFHGELATRDGQGQMVEKLYVHDGRESELRVIAVTVESEGAARSVCDMAGERLRDDDFDVRAAVMGGRPGIVAERRTGLSYEGAAFVTSGAACLGVRISGEEDRLPVRSEVPILVAMVAKGHADVD